ncbi:hypothetical protein TREES_T100002585 [Tupaia chinensis]|uniref:Uncharacterized protein n=1 Tax=Tupaia chinensis TaxID=246437 RepID=L9L607_TUPCH|nr:hypothetical protein TREES_T100002585 [Tupaia chinensis]
MEQDGLHVRALSSHTGLRQRHPRYICLLALPCSHLPGYQVHLPAGFALLPPAWLPETFVTELFKCGGGDRGSELGNLISVQLIEVAGGTVMTQQHRSSAWEQREHEHLNVNNTT